MSVKTLLQNVKHKYSRLSLNRNPMGKIVCSNYRMIRIIESHSKFKLARGFAEGGRKIVRIIERFELQKFEIVRVHCTFLECEHCSHYTDNVRNILTLFVIQYF